MTTDNGKFEEGFQEFPPAGRKLKTSTWYPEGEPSCLAYICHGYGEQILPYYDELAKAGAAMGALCFAHDHTGHGDSEGEKVQVESMDEYVLPVIEHCKKYRKKYKGLPLFLIGHSMGGLISICTSLNAEVQKENLIDGMVLIGPLAQANPKISTPLKVFLANSFANIFPKLALGEIKAEDITSNQKWLEYIKKDDKRWHGGFKALHSIVLLNRLKELDAEFEKISIPVLIFQGGQDQICDKAGAETCFQKISSKDKTYKLLQENRHNLLLEDVSAEVVNEIWEWIGQRKASSGQ